ncbi:glycosyltransferase, partial [Vibrio parahaemolyticus]|uniref:CgeB family protein n=1 Tax=Vibrio parahaemolyticus TaxID=670 RepID=UPI001EFDFABD
GDFRFDYYDQSLFESMIKHNEVENVDKFEWRNYFSNYQYNNWFKKIFYTIENRFKVGPVVNRINRDLIEKTNSKKYDVIFLWRAIHIFPETIEEMRKNSVVIGYNNDQTFSSHHPWWLFRLLKKSIPYYDHFFVYRPKDISAIESRGTTASVFMPTFDQDRIFPIEPRFQNFDIAFIGHFEDDGRDELILKMLEKGFNVLLRGQRWSESKHYKVLTDAMGEIVPAYDDYNKCLNSAKVCLSFLSKLNSDGYTRRTLEIPATKTTMLAEFTKEQATMFEPDIEAVYFRDHDEALEKLSFLINNPDKREKIALAGYEKVKRGPYQLADRVNEIIEITDKYSQ